MSRNPDASPAPAGKSDIRQRLREATAQTHERLHHHPGFSAAASGAISLPDYRRLLERLLGFHRAFEPMLSGAAARDGLDLDLARLRRSATLEADLIALGQSPSRIAELPACDRLTPARDRAEAMGALYVVEGSTLGGLHIARALEGVCARLGGAGRGYFLGYGDQHGAMWRAFLAELDAFARTDPQRAGVVRGATTAFLDFEMWMDGWRSAPEIASASVDL
jgi:heme oxygenase